MTTVAMDHLDAALALRLHYCAWGRGKWTGPSRKRSTEVILKPSWQSLTRHVQTLGFLRRRAGTYRRAREQRLTALRQFAVLHGWNVTGLSADLSGCWPIPPLKGSLSAQAELAIAGDWHGRTAMVSSILVQPPPSPMARTARRPRDVVMLLTALHVGRNDQQLIATRTATTIDIMSGSGSVATLQQPLRALLCGAVQSGKFHEGDTLKLGEGDVALAHQLSARHAALDVGSCLDLLVGVARLLVQ
jgi:hypothetical protein